MKILSTLFLLLLLSSAASAQSADETVTLVELTTAELQSRLYAVAPEQNRDKAGASKKVVELYARIARSPDLTRALLAMKLSEYNRAKESARSAPQAQQAAAEAAIDLQLLQVQQNAVVIELLKQLTTKR